MKEAAENKDTPLPTQDVKNNILMPNITVDCVILGFQGKSMMVLLHKEVNADKWMLPWSFVKNNESVGQTALNILKEKTGLKDAYTKQYHLFGEINEDISQDSSAMIKINSKEAQENRWIHQRCLSLAYYILVKYDEVVINIERATNTAWFAIQNLPAIYEDHKKQINAAVNIIKQQMGFIPIGFELLPRKFTMPELRSIYETILDRELDRRNFQRKMLSAGIVIPLKETRKSGPHKAPNLYMFDQEKHEKAREFGLQLTSSKF